MKRLKVFLLIALLILAALLWGGQRALERTLDAELPALLSSQLGIQVSLDPIRTELRTLRAQSPKLVMGDPAKPALVATDISVALAWHELLRGEIRLVTASADDLMLKLSLWPSTDSPLPDNYDFLEPYLPAQLELTSGRYLTAGDDVYPVSHVQWQRNAERASLAWQETRGGVNIDLAAELSSLPDLLSLVQAELQLSLQAGDDKASRVAVQLDLQPGNTSGYALNATATAKGMSAQLATGNTSAWELPQHSTIHAKQLELGELQTLVDSYSNSSKGKDATESRLAAALPHLDLPLHSGNIAIDEIRWEDEVVTNSTVDFSTGPGGIKITSLSAQGPAGKLLAKGGVDSSTTGWTVNFVADITATQANQSLAPGYLDADWLWHSGHADLAGEGTNWGSLLDSLRGELSLAGSHSGKANTPVTVQALLDSSTDKFALDSIDIKIGGGHITGTAALTGKQQRRLSADIKARDLNLDFLQAAPDKAAEPGMVMPEFFDALPGVELDWKLDVSSLTIGDLHITQAKSTVVRNAEQGKFTAIAIGTDGGSLDLEIDGAYLPDKPSEVTLRADFAHFNIPRLFRQTTGIIDSRTSGTIKFSSQGNGVDQVFSRMQGEANLDIDLRPDHDWQRASQPNEQVRISGKAALVAQDKRIQGIQITQLAVDSFKQNLTGNLSLVDGRKPWLIADLESDGLDIPSLMKFKSPSSVTAPETDPLASLRKLGNARLNLKADSLLIGSLAMKEMVLQVSAAPEQISVEQLDFSLANGSLKSRGGLNWKEGEAALSLDAQVVDLDLNTLFSDTPSPVDAPVSGTVILNGKGRTVPQLLAGLTGDIQLHASSPQTGVSNTGRREVSMTARRTAKGMQAVIHSFKWGSTDITGSVEYQDSTPPLLEVEVTGGSVSLLDFEGSDKELKAKTDKQTEDSIVSKTAMASVDFVGDVIRAPFKFLSGTREATPGEKLFSTEPLPFAWLAKQQATIKGRLDKLSSHEGESTDLTFSVELLDGQLSAQTNAGTVNHGTGSLQVKLNMGAQPATAAFTGTFKDLRGDLVKGNTPRSGHFDLTSHGHTQAELAANLSGIVYLELGPGTLDYTKLMLLTADVATSMFRTLIPGADTKPTQLECAVTLGVFKDGMGVTPYGYAARTDLANLVGKLEIDMKKELIHMNFSSSSRKGIGLSVGNVFSNTVEVEGPLSDPEVVPTGLLWRGWAAVMTGGLSVVGESMLKRALASENPCKTVRKQIHKEFCPSNPAAAASAMICPPA